MCSFGQANPTIANHMLSQVSTLIRVTASQEGKWLSKVRIHMTVGRAPKLDLIPKVYIILNAFRYKGEILLEKYILPIIWHYTEIGGVNVVNVLVFANLF